MILNVVIIILETKFDCVIGTLQGKKSKLLRCYITYLTILFGNFTSSWDLLISLCLSNTTTEVYTPITKSCSDDAGISPSFFLFPLCFLALSLSLPVSV